MNKPYTNNDLLVESYPSCVSEHVPLGNKTWFKTGGTARWFAAPQSADEFQRVVLWARAKGLSLDLIGEGANMLVSDEGCDQMIIYPSLTRCSFSVHDDDSAFVVAEAGVPFSVLIDFCLQNRLLGLEEFSGIPGTVGGSVFINIHYFKFLLSDFLVAATVLEKETGAFISVDRTWFNFGYNYSTLHEQKYILIDATFQVRQADEYKTAYARGRSAEIIRHRMQRYPSKRTCGSFFRNFHDYEVSEISNGKKMIYVAYYLDRIGVKGRLGVGGAQVSYQHANMIVTTETATSYDVVCLARMLQKMIYEQFGILPQPECRFLGFAHYPLLTHSNIKY